MRHIASWILISFAFLLLPKVIPGIAITSFSTALIIAALWGLVNVLIKPVLHLILFPITLLTLGLSSILINALLFWGVASLAGGLNIGFTVQGFMPALLGSLVISVATYLAHKLLSSED